MGQVAMPSLGPNAHSVGLAVVGWPARPVGRGRRRLRELETVNTYEGTHDKRTRTHSRAQTGIQAVS